MSVVPRQNTPLSAERAAELMREAVETFGLPESAALLLMAYSWGIETGQGQKMQNHSWGNITAGKSWVGDIWRPTWYEITDASSERDKLNHARMLKGQAPRAFRAYPSFQDGLDDYLTFLQQPGFKPIIDAAASNDPGRMIAQVKLTGYSADVDLNAHTATLLKLRDQLAPLFPEIPEGTIETHPRRGMAGLAGLLGAMGALFFSLEKFVKDLVDDETDA